MNRLYTRILYQKETGLGLDYITGLIHYSDFFHKLKPELKDYLEWLEAKVAELQEIIDEPIRNEKNKGSLKGTATKHIWNE